MPIYAMHFPFDLLNFPFDLQGGATAKARRPMGKSNGKSNGNVGGGLSRMGGSLVTAKRVGR